MDGLVFLILIAVMWAVLLVPQQRRMKRHRELLATLTVGDDVVTSGGIYGTITGEDDDDLFLLVSEGVEIRVARSAIGGKVEFEDDDDGDGPATDELAAGEDPEG